VRIVEGGAINQTALDVILANGRDPVGARAQLMALISGCHAGKNSLRSLARRFGAEAFHRACQSLRAQTRDLVGQALTRTIAEEPQSFEDQIDDDGLGNGPFELRLATWREGGHAYFDWTGTSAAAPGPVNFFLHIGLAKMFVGDYLMRRTGAGAASDDGYYDLIHIVLPDGTLLRPDLPAPLGHGAHALARQADVLEGAIGRRDPGRLSAAGYGATPLFTYSGHGFRMTDPVFGGLAGGPHADGKDGRTMWPGGRSQSTERLEGWYPVVLERVACIPDSGGAGRHRGGCGVEKVYHLLEQGHVSLTDDRHTSKPWGVNGGEPGVRSAKRIIRADGSSEDLPAKIEGLPVQPGDRIVFRTAGGGGHGNPRERIPRAVQLDVRAGLVSHSAAASVYGVVLKGPGHDIDQRATAELRNGMMREGGATKTFDRGGKA